MRQGFAVVMMFSVTTGALAQDAGPPGEVARSSRGAAKVIVGRVIDVQARFEKQSVRRSVDRVARGHGSVRDVEGRATSDR